MNTVNEMAQSASTPQQIKELTNPDKQTGMACGIKDEPSNTFKFNEAPCEYVIEGKNNNYIVFGRDRYGTFEEGYGGKGHDKASSIDIVVGRLSTENGVEYLNKKIDPSPGADAARIYISQKADIDKYYKLAGGLTPHDSVAKSAVIIKADDVRLVSRNTFKIVTNTDVKLSSNDVALNCFGVQLIANNDDSDLQPIPKGDNLVLAFKDLVQSFRELSSIVKHFVTIQKSFNSAMADHVHHSPFFGLSTSPSLQAMNSYLSTGLQIELKVEQATNSFRANLKNFESTYLDGTDRYINSYYHYLN